jgi:hypothetical protein
MIGIAEFHPMILWEFSLNSDGLNRLLGFGLLWSIRESIVQLPRNTDPNMQLQLGFNSCPDPPRIQIFPNPPCIQG